MLVVVGSRHDAVARRLVERWSECGAALLACEDLSVRGWQHRPFDRCAARAVVNGKTIDELAIRGVLVRRPTILAEELGHIASADREYVAAEMNAFLVSWLSQLSCPVLNRPSGMCLCGPSWGRQQWTHAAKQAGLHAAALPREVPAPEPRPPQPIAPPIARVTVVCDRVIGAPDADCAAGAKRLAARAGVRLLEIGFMLDPDEPHFAFANPMPDLLRDLEVADAVRAHLASNRVES